jgi:hypothetical protein
MEAVLENPAISSQWRYALLGLLEQPSAPRVCSTEDLARLVQTARPNAAPATVRAAIDGLVEARALLKVSRGLYVNRRARPTVELAEAARHIRQGALVSLESVLGECGFLNNPAAIVTAVLPFRTNSVPNVGTVKTSGGQVFRFSALPERLFPRTEADQRSMLQAGRFFPVAKPEVAALHWLYLALSPRSPMREAPQDVDFSVLDLDLLKKLAWQWDLARPLQEWMQRVELTGDIQEPSELVARTEQAAEESRNRGAGAKERLLARRRNSTPST